MAERVGLPLMPWQRLVADVGGEIDPATGLPAYREVILTVPRQSGKDLGCSTPILTTAGWETMGTVEVGDEVYGPDGVPTPVTFTSEVFTGHRCYEVEFEDGAVILAGEDHLWWVWDKDGHDPARWESRAPGEPKPHGVWRTVSTAQIAGSRWGYRRMNGRMEYRYRVRCDAIVQSPPADLPVDPYVLGYWLGNGTTGTGRVTTGGWKGAQDVGHVVRRFGPAARVVRSEPEHHVATVHVTGLRVGLETLGVLGDKHIPDVYLNASPTQRRALLAGLVDSDGHISDVRKSPRIEYCTISKRLAWDVFRLVRSLGVKATLRENDARLYGRRVSSRYRICWTPTFNPFTLPRKAEVFHPPMTGRHQWMSIVGVREVPTVPTRCIQVAHPEHVFLVGELFTPTHNTTLVLGWELQRALGWGSPQRVVYSAQSGNDARKKLIDDQVPILEPRARKLGIRRILRGMGNEAVEFVNGSRISLLASTDDSGHGKTLDLGVKDELFADGDERRDQSMVPAMATRAAAQILTLSTMGTDDSVALNRAVDRGRAAVDEGARTGVAYFEWSAGVDDDPDDPATWWACMPALGHTITEDVVAHASGVMLDGEFRRAFLTQRTRA
ncbi:MAG: LAGLIDADG family homing endonuclease, partial [Candidatus Rokuibacteriota bacterium]